MRNPLTSPGAIGLGLLLARAPLGVCFILAGFVKFTAPGGTAEFTAKNKSLVPVWFPQQAGLYYLAAIPYAEIVVGASLVLGVAARLGGLAAALMLVSFMVAVTGFGSASSFHPNVVFLGITLLIVLAGPGPLSMDKFMGQARDPRNA